MSSSEEVIEVDGEEWVSVDPIQHVNNKDYNRSVEYRFTKAYPGDVEEENFIAPTGAEIEKVTHDAIIYQYKEQSKILVTQEGPHMVKGGDRKDAERQAYFVMSILDEYGMVGRFRRA